MQWHLDGMTYEQTRTLEYIHNFLPPTCIIRMQKKRENGKVITIMTMEQKVRNEEAMPLSSASGV